MRLIDSSSIIRVIRRNLSNLRLEKYKERLMACVEVKSLA